MIPDVIDWASNTTIEQSDASMLMSVTRQENPMAGENVEEETLASTTKVTFDVSALKLSQL